MHWALWAPHANSLITGITYTTGRRRHTWNELWAKSVPRQRAGPVANLACTLFLSFAQTLSLAIELKSICSSSKPDRRPETNNARQQTANGSDLWQQFGLEKFAPRDTLSRSRSSSSSGSWVPARTACACSGATATGSVPRQGWTRLSHSQFGRNARGKCRVQRVARNVLSCAYFLCTSSSNNN